MKSYTTRQGDMWDKIAHEQLGSIAHTDRLMNLNASYLGYYVFPAGITLQLPDVSPDENGTMPPWKQVAG